MPYYFEEMCRLAKPDPSEFNVLCHGDAWTNNCMFSNDNKKNPTDILFLDYQISHWTSPAYDLYYTFTTSVKADVKETEFDNLISIYHDELVSSLTNLKYTGKIPSLRQLHIDLLKRGFLPTVLVISLAVIALESKDDSIMKNLLGQDEEGINFKKSMYQSKNYYKQLEALYLFLESRGLLDIM